MSNRSKKSSVPEAQSALNRFKFEVASELGVPLSEGYNGDLTSRQNGSVGGYMVKKMIEAQEKQMAERYNTNFPTTSFNSPAIFSCWEDISDTAPTTADTEFTDCIICPLLSTVFWEDSATLDTAWLTS